MYDQIWFHIKMNHAIKHVPKDLWLAIRNMSYLPDNLKKAAISLFSNECLLGSPRKYLGCHIGEDKDIRQQAAKVIKEARTYCKRAIYAFRIVRSAKSCQYLIIRLYC
jgi:hypothetical protein